MSGFGLLTDDGPDDHQHLCAGVEHVSYHTLLVALAPMPMPRSARSKRRHACTHTWVSAQMKRNSLWRPVFYEALQE